ncbi:MAG: hypothetical protein ABRQ26_15845 [Syntrophomonadaceae bacterium]
MPSLMLYSITGFLILFIVLEITPLVRKKEWKQLIVPVIFFGLTTLYGIDYVFALNILPNPNKTLYLFKPLSENLEKILQISI